MHIAQQVSNAVAVAILVVIPTVDGKKIRKCRVKCLYVKKSVTLSFNRAQKHLKNQPGNKLDKVVAKGDASTSIKDGGVTVPNEVRGDHLQNRQTQMTQCV